MTNYSEFFGNSLFIPIFFVATGFLIDPVVFFRSIAQHFALTAGIILALLIGKWVAAEIAVRAFKYSHAARMTMWSLTLPQVAATLAAALVAYDIFNPAGQRLLDGHLPYAVLVMMLTTSILGPILTEGELDLDSSQLLNNTGRYRVRATTCRAGIPPPSPPVSSSSSPRMIWICQMSNKRRFDLDSSGCDDRRVN